jgi:hypothetical protein
MSNPPATEDRQRTSGVNTDRTTARIVGVLYIIGAVGGMLSLVFTEPVRRGSGDSLRAGDEMGDRMRLPAGMHQLAEQKET